MKILVWPTLLIIAPLALLFAITKLWPSILAVSKLVKVFVALVFIAAGLVSSVYAVGLSMQGYQEVHAKCLTGITVFIPYSLSTNFIGVPWVLGLMKSSAVRGR